MHPVLLHTLAQAEPAAPAPGGSPMNFILMMALFMGAMWFLIIAPQRKRQKAQQRMLDSLKPVDKIITSGGIHGTIQQVQADRLVIKVADNTRIELSKGFVHSKVQETATETSK